MKKLTALILILVVTFTAIPAASAAAFTDVANSSEAWAESYINDMTERGLYTGFSDGTFRPKENIILLHTLVLFSRLYTLDDATTQQVLNEYNGFLTEILKGKGIDWAFPQLAICLETGIATRDELREFASSGALDKPVTKEFFAMLLARAIQLEDDALALTEFKLPFDDYLFIKYSYWPYIYMLYTKQVILGDTYNKFNPQEVVSRAISATMVSKAINYIESNGIQLRVTRFSEYRTYGILSEIGTGNVLIKDHKGTSKRITLPAGSFTKVDGVAAQLSASHIGKYVALVWSKEDQSLKGIEINTGITAVQGAVKAVETQTITSRIYITDLAAGTTTGYTLGNNISVYYEDAVVPMNSLKPGYYATVILQNNNTVTSIHAYSGTYEKVASLSSIIFGDPITFVLTDANGEITELKFSANQLPPIWKGGSISGADKLRNGDSLKLTVKDSVITRIDAQVREADLTGTINKFTKDATGNILTISNENGVEISYKLAPDVLITQNSKKLTIENLNIGSRVKLVITDEYITSIEVSELATENLVISGTVMYINSRDLTFLLQMSDGTGSLRQVTVHLSGTAKILNANDGSFTPFNYLKIYDVMDIYGSYSGDQFEATIIIIRSKAQ